MEQWDTVSNKFTLRYDSCWRTDTQTKIIRTSLEKYYYLDCLATFDFVSRGNGIILALAMQIMTSILQGSLMVR